MATALTTCPFCACGCGIHLVTDGGMAVASLPSQNHPVSHGTLCARGWSAHEAPSWGERLTVPRVRRGAALVPASWEEALAAAATGLDAARRHGAGTVVVVSARATNEEAFLAARLARELGTSASCALAPGYLPLALGLGDAVGGTLAEVEACDVGVVFGTEVGTSHPRVASALLAARRRGATLITAGWTRTPLTRLADPHLEASPAGLVGMAERLLAAARAGGWEREGAPGAAITAVRRLAQASRPALLVGPMALDAPSLLALGETLGALWRQLGHDRREGAVLLPLPARSNLRGVAAAGATATPDSEHAAAVLVVGSDGLAPGPADFVVLLDAFAGPALDGADVVLPIASFAESDGTVTNLEGRHQLVVASLPPPGAARPGWRAVAALLEELGAAAVPADLEAVRAELRSASPTAPGRGLATAPAPSPPDAAFPLAVVSDGVVDWGRDPLVFHSPTLCRDEAARRKLFPAGTVEISAADAERLGVRQGWRVHFAGPAGEATVPVTVRRDLEAGVLQVPAPFREQLSILLPADGVAGARAERA